MARPIGSAAHRLFLDGPGGITLRCGRCAVFKPEGAFWVQASGDHGRQNTCVACRNELKALFRKPCGCGALIERRVRRCRKCWNAESALRFGVGHPAWRGGMFIKLGYVMIYNRSKQDYEPEHRLVMERILGRKLLPKENVHHKNGVRHDNRPENLELWTRAQNPGKRVVDLVKHAKWVLATYEPSAIAPPRVTT